MRHTHRCTVCGDDIPCHGRAVDNYDGIPPKYCERVDPYQEQHWMCADCYADQQDERKVRRNQLAGVRLNIAKRLREVKFL